MNPQPIFHPRIEADVRNAMTGYDERSPGLGGRFKRAFYDTVNAILLFPLKHAAKVDGDIRMRLMRPFPYLVYYVAESSTVYVLSVEYAGRKPSYLRASARGRRPE